MPTGYDTTLHNPVQAAREFGRAALAGVGFNINAVTPQGRSSSSSSKKKTRLRSGRIIYDATDYQAPKRMRHAVATRSRRVHPGWSAMADIGQPVGLYQTKKDETDYKICDPDTSNYVWRDKSLFGLSAATPGAIGLILVPYSASTESLSSRSTIYVNHRGVKLDIIFARKPEATLPLTIHYAILTNRQGDASSITGLTNKFWMSNDPDTELGEDFANTGPVWDYERMLNKRQNHVIMRGKVQMGISDTGNATDTTQWMTTRRKHYIKTNKQVKFPVLTEPNPEENLWMIFWYTVKDDLNTTQQVPAVEGNANGPKISMRVVNYWKKSKIYS